MEEIKIIKSLNDEVIQEIIARTIKAVDPDKIILFGSYAYGKPKKYSDIDILIVMKSHLPRHKRSIEVYDALRGLIIPKDIVVYTPEEIKEWEDVPQAFVTSIIKRGRVIYEKQT